MDNLIKKQIIELADELKKYVYADEEAICWNGSLLDLANYDLSIEYYNRNIYGNYSATVASVYSQYIYLVNINIDRATRILAMRTTSHEDFYEKYFSNIIKYFPQDGGITHERL